MSFTVIDYEINKARIIAEQCINKDTPVLKCHGKCYLKKQLDIDKSVKTPVKQTTSKVLLLFGFYENLATKYLFLLEKETSQFYNLTGNISSALNGVDLPPPEGKA